MLSHAVDGFSLALDFRITRGNRAAVNQMAQDLSEIVLEAGGRFYFAKDSTLTPERVERYLGRKTLDQFFALKQRCDPDNLLQTDLYRRCFLPLQK